MSSQKEKFLASAQKFIQKGQFDRALRDYEQVVTADPKDVRHRQKLAELMVRCNRKDDAIREYETIARFYDENRFYLKSIAVYKQIQRLDPSNVAISLSLALLNEKQGMIGNALTEYKVVFDNYAHNGQVGESIAILDKMKSLDPDNVDIKLKLAEVLFSSGSGEKAYQAFTQAALLVKSRGNQASYDKICGRIQELFPDKSEAILDIIAEQIKSGIVTDAIPKLEQVLCEDPGNLRVLGLLVDAYRISGDHEKLRDCLRQILQRSPDNLDAKKRLIESSLENCPLEESYPIFEMYLPDLYAAGAYGELERYYTSMQNMAPYDTRLLTGLKKLYEVTGESGKLRDVQVSINILTQKGADNGPGSGVASVPGHEPRASSPVEDTETADRFPWEDEIDLSAMPDIDSGPQSVPVGAGPIDFEPESLSSTTTANDVAKSGEFDIDISFDFSDDAAIFAGSKPESAEESTGCVSATQLTAERQTPDKHEMAEGFGSGQVSKDAGDEILQELDILDEQDLVANSGTGRDDGTGVAGTTAAWGERPEIAADFATPSELEPPVREHLEEVQETLAEEHSGQMSSEGTEMLLELDPFIEIELDIEAPLTHQADQDEEHVSVVPDSAPVEEITASPLSSEEQVLSLADEIHETEAAAPADDSSVTTQTIESVPLPGELPSSPGHAGIGAAVSEFDSASQTSDTVPARDEMNPPLPQDTLFHFDVEEFTLDSPGLENGAATDKYDFDGMFSRFKESLDQHVDEGDTETHYNLGIAYMEMGLFGDAIKEFRIAGSDPDRRTDCVTLQGICCREKGDYAQAEELFRSEIAGTGIGAERLLSLHYELGLLYEAAGRPDDALQSYREVFGVNPGFRDTMKKIARLSGNDGSLDLSDVSDADIELEEIR